MRVISDAIAVFRRLKVPKIRSFIEYSNFIILFLLYILALEGLTQGKINWKETAFIVYAMGEPILVEYRKPLC